MSTGSNNIPVEDKLYSDILMEVDPDNVWDGTKASVVRNVLDNSNTYYEKNCKQLNVRESMIRISRFFDEMIKSGVDVCQSSAGPVGLYFYLKDTCGNLIQVDYSRGGDIYSQARGNLSMVKTAFECGLYNWDGESFTLPNNDLIFGISLYTINCENDTIRFGLIERKGL